LFQAAFNAAREANQALEDAGGSLRVAMEGLAVDNGKSRIEATQETCKGEGKGGEEKAEEDQ